MTQAPNSSNAELSYYEGRLPVSTSEKSENKNFCDFLCKIELITSK